MTSSMILLADGTTLRGQGFGASGTTIGEFVFHTGMTGYQEILSDPSYCGQCVTMTCPEIGNTGINDEDMESRAAWLSAFVIRNLSPVVSNWRAQKTLDEFLRQQGVVGIQQVDTRALTLQLREHGAMMGIVSDELTLDEMRRELEAATPIEEQDLVSKVSTDQPYTWSEGTWALGSGFQQPPERRFRVVALDFGVKFNILRLLADQGCVIEVLPADTPAADILARNPDGIFLSNGPGDPRRRPDLSEKVAELVGKKPIFGICFGFQLLGPALGASITKLRFGHHGANHPVRHEDAEGVWITSQNHNYVVDAQTLPKGVDVSDINLNDQTLEGFIDRERGILAIQYHPEASPGPHDARGLFASFAQMMQQWQG
ncbi:MAG: carbamoyl-phosphate synthase small subunit [Candidatus Dadabacteria bacterium]|nr:MAG: carbamoyl-phosphate synthase small subunit [Candidatus Dadabacteria bacterium]